MPDRSRLVLCFVLVLFAASVLASAAEAGYRSYRRSTRYSTSYASPPKAASSSCSAYPEPATLYVDGKSGNDGGPGSAAHPFRTIQAGVNAALARADEDIVQVAPVYGAYHENVVISDTSGAVTLRGCADKAMAVVVDGDGLTAILISLMNDVTLKNLVVTDAASGIAAQGPGTLTVWGVTATRNSSYGIIGSLAGRVVLHQISASRNGIAGVYMDHVLTVKLEHVNASYNSNVNIYFEAVEEISLHYITADHSQFGVDAFSFGTLDAEHVTANWNGYGVAMTDGGKAKIGYVTANGNELAGIYGERLERVSGHHLVANGRSSLSNVFIFDIAGDVNLSGVTANDGDVCGVYVAQAANIWVSGATADDNAYGFCFFDTERIELRYSEAVGNLYEGVFAEAAKEFELTYVKANSNGDNGLFTDGIERVKILGGWYKFNAVDGILLAVPDSVWIGYANITYNGDDGLEVRGPAPVSLYRNFIEYNADQNVILGTPP